MTSFLERLGRAIRGLFRGPRIKPAAGPDQWTDGSFAQQGRAIAYKLFIPARGSGTPRPLVVMLHGCTQNPEDFARGTGMNRHAAERGVLVLYPAQMPHANPGKCWNWFLAQHQRADRGEPALLAALTRSVMDSHAVDPARVYVAGLSAGGAMADILGRTHSELFAAAGVHSGLTAGAARDLMSALAVMKNGPDASLAGPAAPPAPPTIVFHGDDDGTVHPLNGIQVVTAALGPRDADAPRQQTEGRSPQGQAFTRREYADAQGRIDVEYWLLHGGGHAWSGGGATGTFTDPAGPDASAEMLRFFLAHPMQKNDGNR
jgi:poly(hydroxyalkanoate) depolymerase family esterase